MKKIGRVPWLQRYPTRVNAETDRRVMSEFLQYLPNVFTSTNLLVLSLGTIGGLILGAAPGLSPTMAVALPVPFTMHMESVSGLILLGSVYTATVARGALSAILEKIPGAPANITTLLDGYPMAQQGASQKALYICFFSSLIGGLFGMLIMIVFSPLLANVALKFGASEMFWLAIFGITVMAGLASGSIEKGLIGGMFGLAGAILFDTKYNLDTIKPLANWGADPAVLIVPKDSPFNSTKDLVDFAKKNPGKASVNGGALYNGHHIAFLQLAKALEADLTCIPEKGVVPTMHSVIAGKVKSGFNNLADSYRNSDRLKILAVADVERHEFLLTCRP